MIKLFTSEGCVNCRSTKKLLQRLLQEFGSSYENEVLELDIKDPDALAELLMLNTEYVPTVIIGEVILTGKDVTDEGKIRAALTRSLKNAPSNR
ncbi:MAG: glutaredoxin family protein [Candidatus Methanomethylicaceae archaeon]